jgi:hypothetical protein
VARALLDADLSHIKRMVIERPLVYSDTLTDGTFVLIPDVEAIRAAVHELLSAQRSHVPTPN